MSEFEDLRVECIQLALKIIWKRKNLLESKNYTESDRLRKVITDIGMKIEDIKGFDGYNSTNLDHNYFEHKECRDIVHCVKKMDHKKRLEEIINKFKNELSEK